MRLDIDLHSNDICNRERNFPALQPHTCRLVTYGFFKYDKYCYNGKVLNKVLYTLCDSIGDTKLKTDANWKRYNECRNESL